MWKWALDRAGVREPVLRRDYTEQRRVVRRFATAEYAAARLLLPAALLPHVVAAVAFMHDTDDRIDRGAPDERAAALVEWDGLVRKAFAEGDSGLPVLRCLVRTAERHPDVRVYVEGFLRGCELEVAWRAIADEEELEQYVREYSLPALMLTACLLAPADVSGRAVFMDGCHRLICAMQRIDFLEDLAEDVRGGRLGVPADAVARHRADLSRPGAALGRLVEEQADRAATDLAAAFPLTGVVEASYRPFVRALVGVQGLRLDAVRRAGASLAVRSSGPPGSAAAVLLLREVAARARRAPRVGL
ncbi:squalene/phytoene synthase family protein [Streptomyces sp. P9(2023)]|uniref:squalene/phytoene synthase family protein n=1 Tax=Streptomyces sp. P9(2023) TaxID=3064394 RepID=UPI0028F41256|nr:squalene/phytoene synthase family protein [Streptomyces sp. P9(2023)]MDT9692741.1 squalene/phytoene synthase family protein [Streptomyces sp. P9(2023)]